MVDIGSVVFASGGMALFIAGLGALFPASHRPWWHARPRAESGVQARLAALAAQPTVVPLTVIERIDRRGQPLPFVGKDRRKSARATARQDHRRHGNGH